MVDKITIFDLETYDEQDLSAQPILNKMNELIYIVNLLIEKEINK